MDFLLILIAITFGFVLFLSISFFLAKWIFPRLKEEEDLSYQEDLKRNLHIPRISKKNPYSFK